MTNFFTQLQRKKKGAKSDETNLIKIQKTHVQIQDKEAA